MGISEKLKAESKITDLSVNTEASTFVDRAVVAGTPVAVAGGATLVAGSAVAAYAVTDAID